MTTLTFIFSFDFPHAFIHQRHINTFYEIKSKDIKLLKTFRFIYCHVLKIHNTYTVNPWDILKNLLFQEYEYSGDSVEKGIKDINKENIGEILPLKLGDVDDSFKVKELTFIDAENQESVTSNRSNL